MANVAPSDKYIKSSYFMFITYFSAMKIDLNVISQQIKLLFYLMR